MATITYYKRSSKASIDRRYSQIFLSIAYANLPCTSNNEYAAYTKKNTDSSASCYTLLLPDEEAGKMQGIMSISKMKESPTVIGHRITDVDGPVKILV